MFDDHLTIRAATRHDSDALARLARRERCTLPAGHALLAERDDVAIAALALTSGSIFADPSRHTTDAVPLLRHRRYQLLRQGGDVGPAWSLLRRLAPPAATT